MSTKRRPGHPVGTAISAEGLADPDGQPGPQTEAPGGSR